LRMAAETRLQDMVMGVVNAVPNPAIRDELLDNVLIIGGTTTIPGFVARLKSELQKLAGREVNEQRHMSESKKGRGFEAAI